MGGGSSPATHTVTCENASVYDMSSDAWASSTSVKVDDCILIKRGVTAGSGYMLLFYDADTNQLLDPQIPTIAMGSDWRVVARNPVVDYYYVAAVMPDADIVIKYKNPRD